jgi:hypothetical protein
MKLLSGAVLLLAAEQAYAHSHLIGFPNHEVAADVLIPAAVVFLVLGSLLVTWGLFAEGRCSRNVADTSLVKE